MQTYDLNVPGFARPLGNGLGQGFMTDAALSGGMAFLTSELEKLDPRLNEPLSSFFYPRDIPVVIGGGWADTTASLFTDYGVSGGSGEDAGAGGAANDVGIIQGNTTKSVYPTHPYQRVLRVKWIDAQRSDVIGRSLEQLYNTGLRLDYDKHLDLNCYLGYNKFNTVGLVNNPEVITGPAANNAAGTSTVWANKSADEILADVNNAINAVWMACEYAVMPNHILVNPANYAMLVARKVDPLGSKSILTYLMENNLAVHQGFNIEIFPSRFCGDDPALPNPGTGGTNRMVVYVNNSDRILMDILQPLTRSMVSQNTTFLSYDTAYAANIGSVRVLYLESIRYVDGI